MRNYFKMQAMKWPFTSNIGSGTLYAWGGTDEQLLEHVLQTESITRDLFGPTFHATRTSPVVVWWELNQENFGVLLQYDAQSVYEATRLGSSVGGLVGISKLQPEGSPRKVWSHGH